MKPVVPSRALEVLLNVEDTAVLSGQIRSSFCWAIDRGDRRLHVLTINCRRRILDRSVERLIAGASPEGEGPVNDAEAGGQTERNTHSFTSEYRPGHHGDVRALCKCSAAGSCQPKTRAICSVARRLSAVTGPVHALSAIESRTEVADDVHQPTRCDYQTIELGRATSEAQKHAATHDPWMPTRNVTEMVQQPPSWVACTYGRPRHSPVQAAPIARWMTLDPSGGNYAYTNGMTTWLRSGSPSSIPRSPARLSIARFAEHPRIRMGRNAWEDQ